MTHAHAHNHLAHMKLQQAARQYAMKAGGFTNAMADAQSRAAKLTHKELRNLLDPIRHAVTQAKRGLLVERQWLQLCSALNIGQAIEAGGVVRGLTPQLDAAHDALEAISLRATGTVQPYQTAPWKCPTLYATELAALDELLTVHSFQLKQISYGEYQAAWKLATSRVRSAGGEVVAGEPIVVYAPANTAMLSAVDGPAN